MKEIAIVGPGGLGGTFAALLGLKGQCSVTVIGRPGAHIDAIRAAGLNLTGLKDGVARIDAVDDPAEITACDALIFVVKAQDTAAVAEWARTACAALADQAWGFGGGEMLENSGETRQALGHIPSAI